MKKNKKGMLFLKSFLFSMVLAFCVIFSVFSVAKIYTSCRKIGFDEDKKAVEINKNGFRILDFKFTKKSGSKN